MQLCEVIVDIAHANVDKLFTYAVPEDLRLQSGSHVLVPFGSGNRSREGFVIRVFERGEEELRSSADAGEITLKTVLRMLEPYPILTGEQIELACWMQKSYHCLLVDALRLMIPAQMRGGRVKEKVERTIQLSVPDRADEMLASLLDKSGKSRAPRQTEVLELLANAKIEFSVSDIAAYIPGSAGAISALIKRGFLVEGGHVTFRRPDLGAIITGQARYALSGAGARGGGRRGGDAKRRRHAFAARCDRQRQDRGVYARHRALRLSARKQAIMLVPEISLTPQTVGLFRERFEDGIAVLHSRLSAGENALTNGAESVSARRAWRSARAAPCSRPWRTSASSSWTRSTSRAIRAR